MTNQIKNPEVETQSTESSRLDHVIDTIRQFASVSELLRFSGAAVMVASMSLFLINGFEVANDVQRYLTLLAQTVLLTCGGFMLSHGLKETKGARVFFGLGLISIPANFAVLGALLYSVSPLDGLSAHYPAFAHWTAGSVGTVTLTALGAVALLVPVALFAFSIMARSNAKSLTVGFMLANASLLIPVRDTTLVVPIATAAILGALWYLRNHVGMSTRLKTAGGRFARMSLFIAPVIMLVRSLYLYDINSAVLLCLTTGVFVVLRYASMQRGGEGLVAQSMDLISILVALVVAGSVASLADALDDSYQLLIFAAASALLLGELAWRTRNESLRIVACIVSSIATAGSLILLGLFSDETIAIVLAAAMAIAYTGWGAAVRSRIQIVGGLLTIVTIGLGNVYTFVDLIDLGNWMVLAVMGAVAIVLGSVLERHGANIKLRVEAWFATPKVREADQG